MEINELKSQFDRISGEIKQFTDSAKSEIETGKKTAAETVERLEKMQKQLDGIDAQIQTKKLGERKSLRQELTENDSVQRLARDGRGTAVITFKGGLPELERKTVIDTAAVGRATSGVLNYERDPGVEMQGMRMLTMRDFIPATPTSANAIDYVKINAFTNAASPQVESSAKGESALTFTTATEVVRTLAHWIPASKQILADMPELESVIRTELIYGLKLLEEQQILLGSGTGNNLNGLITQATAFSTGLMGSGVWHKADLIRRAIQQVYSADQIMPQWVVVNPVDWADIELAKDTTRQYLSGYNGVLYTGRGPQLWGLAVHQTPSITSGTFLVGNSQKVSLRDREEINIEISTEHSTYFTENKVAIRCEERLALLCRRPASFITGTFTTSP